MEGVQKVNKFVKHFFKFLRAARQIPSVRKGLLWEAQMNQKIEFNEIDT
jgi:hypothetical protein